MKSGLAFRRASSTAAAERATAASAASSGLMASTAASTSSSDGTRRGRSATARDAPPFDGCAAGRARSRFSSAMADISSPPRGAAPGRGAPAPPGPGARRTVLRAPRRSGSASAPRCPGSHALVLDDRELLTGEKKIERRRGGPGRRGRVAPGREVEARAPVSTSSARRRLPGPGSAWLTATRSPYRRRSQGPTRGPRSRSRRDRVRQGGGLWARAPSRATPLPRRYLGAPGGPPRPSAESRLPRQRPKHFRRSAIVAGRRKKPEPRTRASDMTPPSADRRSSHVGRAGAPASAERAENGGGTKGPRRNGAPGDAVWRRRCRRQARWETVP